MMRRQAVLSMMLAVPLAAAWPAAVLAKVEETNGYELYIPDQAVQLGPRPLIVLLSPTGDPEAIWSLWVPAAQTYGWYVMGSRRYANARANEMDAWAREIAQDLDSVTAKYPIDAQKVIATGLSGGGSASYVLAVREPTRIAGIVVNTGRIWFLDAPGPAQVFGQDIRAREAARQRARLPHSFAVFVASPTDFRFDEMQRDRRFLTDAGWRTHWIEFKGGHTWAPPPVYDGVAKWMADQLNTW